MLFSSRIFTYVAVGLTAFISSTQATPINAAGLSPRANSTTPDKALGILKKWSANVNATVPYLVALGRAGNDTTPAFDTLSKLYDQVSTELGRLPADDSKEEAPVHHEIAKTISNTFSNVNTAVNNLKGTKINVANGDKLAALARRIEITLEVTVGIGWSLLTGFYVYVKYKLTITVSRFFAGVNEARAAADEVVNHVVKRVLERAAN